LRLQRFELGGDGIGHRDFAARRAARDEAADEAASHVAAADECQ
jgi:hypothetical protein